MHLSTLSLSSCVSAVGTYVKKSCFSDTLVCYINFTSECGWSLYRMRHSSNLIRPPETLGHHSLLGKWTSWHMQQVPQGCQTSRSKSPRKTIPWLGREAQALTLLFPTTSKLLHYEIICKLSFFFSIFAVRLKYCWKTFREP